MESAEEGGFNDANASTKVAPGFTAAMEVALGVNASTKVVLAVDVSMGAALGVDSLSGAAAASVSALAPGMAAGCPG